MLFSEPFPSLKEYAKRFLKIDVPTFLETISKSKVSDGAEIDYNFAQTDPEITYTYAALDPILHSCYCTVLSKSISLYPKDISIG